MPIPSDSPSLVVIAANPRAGAQRGGKLLPVLQEALAVQGIEVAISGSLDDACRLAHDGLEQGKLRALVAAGGDGTITALANRIGPGIPLTVFPLGTANLVAGYLGIDSRVEPFVDMVCQNRQVEIDLAEANGCKFVLMAGIGLDAEVVSRLHLTRQGPLSQWSYGKPLWAALRTYRYPTLTVRAELASGEWIERTCEYAFVTNIPRYAGGLRFAPGADPADGLLDLCLIEGKGFWRGLSYVPFLWFGRQTWRAGGTLWKCRRLAVHSDLDVEYQLDGDPGGKLPVQIQVLPRQLRLIVPPTFAKF